MLQEGIRLGRSDVWRPLNGLETPRYPPRHDHPAMCSQFDFLHDDLPIGWGTPQPNGQHHAKRREARGPKSGVAVTTSGAAGAIPPTDELTLRMIFGDR
jgi:hypothetical protein